MAAPEHVAAIAQTLHASLSSDAAVRRQAEATLGGAEAQQGFLLILLHLIGNADNTVDAVARQTGAVYFKNVVKKLWAEDAAEEVHLNEADKEAIKAQLVPLMIALGTPQTARLQSQIGEALSYIASVDFPDRWPTLIDDLVNSLTADNFVINNGVLATAHSIFLRWRSAFQSNELYSQINYVLERFSAPFGKIFTHVDSLLSGGQADPATLALLGETLPLLIELLYDLNCQDLAPFFEENSTLFLGSSDGQQEGFLRKYLKWERAELMGDDEDAAPGPIQKTRAAICEIAELWAVKYAADFPQLPFFVDGVWNMLANVGAAQRNDQLVARALKFLSVVVKMGTRKEMFAAPETLRMFCEKIILPNMGMREVEEELFEDDPHEFIRQDLEPAADSETRRQAASDFTQALMANFSEQVTGIIKGYIGQYLQAYASNPAENWKSKDTAIYLLTSIAARGSTLSLGVTSTNSLVDIVDFFGQNVFADLQAGPGAVHPILVVDAIKFLYTFRNQLTKEQLVSVLPLLVQHLTSDNYVIHSYAAITIERILFIKVDKKPLFTESDVAPFAENILLALFANIERGGTPEKVAENDYLMKCAMRVIITARSALAQSYEGIFARLMAILGEISKNPSNPKFNQYCFESVSALIRFVCEANPSALAHFEAGIFGPAQVILTQDVAEFVPYIFQILAQLLELHPGNTGLPDSYKALLQPLLAADLWEQRGNVPALVRIWKALLLRGGDVIAQGGQVNGLLGVFQRLVGSKANDIWALEVVQGLYEALPLQTMQPYSKQVFMLLLTRLQGQHSAYFKQSFTYFMAFLFALPSVGPNYVVGVLNEIQPGLFGGLLQGIVLANTQKTSVKQRKVVEVGLTRFITRCDLVLADSKLWAASFLATVDMFNLPQDLTYSGSGADGALGTGDVSELDPEEASFQSSFSKLGASESRARDPVADVPDAKRYASAEIAKVYREKQAQVGPALQQAQQSDAAAFNAWAAYMASNGDQIA